MSATDLILFITTAGIAISCLLGLAFLWSRRQPFVFLGILFLTIGLQLVEEYLWISHQILNYPFFAEISEATPFLIPPLLWFYTQHQGGSKDRIHKWLHFIPAAIAFINFIPIYLQHSAFKLCYIQEEIFEVVPLACFDYYEETEAMLFPEEILDVLLITQFFAYAMLVVKNRQMVSRAKSKKTISIFQQWGKLLAFISLLVIVFLLADIYLFTQSENYFTSLFLSSIVFCCGFFILRQSILLEDNFQSTVYQGLEDTDLEKLWSRSTEIIEKDNLYAKAEFNISLLADRLEVTPNLLSHVFTRQGTNFKALVNKIRIEKALVLLCSKEMEHYSIEGIGNQLGYKSKATFYKHFKARTGQTPKEFIDNQGEKFNST